LVQLDKLARLARLQLLLRSSVRVVTRYPAYIMPRLLLRVHWELLPTGLGCTVERVGQLLRHRCAPSPATAVGRPAGRASRRSTDVAAVHCPPCKFIAGTERSGVAGQHLLVVPTSAHLLAKKQLTTIGSYFSKVLSVGLCWKNTTDYSDSLTRQIFADRTRTNLGSSQLEHGVK
jgi:hypothetical protein